MARVNDALDSPTDEVLAAAQLIDVFRAAMKPWAGPRMRRRRHKDTQVEQRCNEAVGQPTDETLWRTSPVIA